MKNSKYPVFIDQNTYLQHEKAVFWDGVNSRKPAFQAGHTGSIPVARSSP